MKKIFSKKHFKLWSYFALLIFVLLNMFIVGTFSLTMFLYKNGIIQVNGNRLPPNLLSTILVSAILGTIIALIVGKKILKPIINLTAALNKIANGDFSIRLSEKSKLSEIKEMNENFNKMAKELSSIEILRNDFVANVSHEFKTPISAIQGYAVLLQNQKMEEEKKKECLDKIISCTQKLSTLVGNILLLNKLENQEIVSNKNFYLLDEQIRKTILLLENEWSAKNIEFDLELSKTYIFANEELLYHVWFNLINNAIKFSNNDSKIKIEIKKNKETLTIIIQDYGCGISEDSLGHIFNKFYQVNKKNQNGNGLGLALVHKIISLNNAEINVESKLNEGSKFIITFKK